MKIIGLCGLAGSGKDTLADFLVDNENYEKVAFADKVKDIAAVAFDMDRDMLTGSTEEQRIAREKKDEFWSSCLGYDFTPRKALQMVGTELFRNCVHQDFWIMCLTNKILKSNSGKNIVISDCRFPNEIEAIRQMGGKIVRVERQYPRWWKFVEQNNVDDGFLERARPHLQDVHPSEYSWVGRDNPDLILRNTGSLLEYVSLMGEEVVKNDSIF